MGFRKSLFIPIYCKGWRFSFYNIIMRVVKPWFLILADFTVLNLMQYQWRTGQGYTRENDLIGQLKVILSRAVNLQATRQPGQTCNTHQSPPSGAEVKTIPTISERLLNTEKKTLQPKSLYPVAYFIWFKTFHNYKPLTKQCMV